jgi:hypothetical protein
VIALGAKQFCLIGQEGFEMAAIALQGDSTGTKKHPSLQLSPDLERKTERIGTAASGAETRRPIAAHSKMVAVASESQST